MIKTQLDTHGVQSDYPILKVGKRTGIVALFIAPKTAVILKGDDPARTHRVTGYYSTKWKEEQWEVMDPRATLQLCND